jgi:hypothetical protein
MTGLLGIAGFVPTCHAHDRGVFAMGRVALITIVLLLLFHRFVPGWPALALTGLVWVVLYMFSSSRRPFATCRTCNGSGRHSGMIFTYAHRQCPGCGGSGRHRREGLVLFRDGQPTRAEQQAKTAANRRNRPL